MQEAEFVCNFCLPHKLIRTAGLPLHHTWYTVWLYRRVLQECQGVVLPTSWWLGVVRFAIYLQYSYCIVCVAEGRGFLLN